MQRAGKSFIQKIFSFLSPKVTESFILNDGTGSGIEEVIVRKAAKQTEFIKMCTQHAHNQMPSVLASLAGTGQALPFRLDRRKSNLGKKAGDGVFAIGQIPQYSVVCAFAGTIFTPEALRNGMDEEWYSGSSYVEKAQSSKENCWTACRSDGIFIDGRDRGLAGFVFRSAALRDSPALSKPVCTLNWLWQEYQETKDTPDRYWWGMGPLINHPPSSIQPNVVFLEYDFDLSKLTPLERYQIPNVTYSPISDSNNSNILPSVVLLSTRDIRDGEELFVDYSYDEDMAPEWYQPVSSS